MEALKSHLRSLPDEAAREEFAAACDTTYGHLKNCIYTPKSPNPAVCVAIERATQAAVRRWDLRPDDWMRIWPELIGAPGAPAVEAKAA